MRRNHFKMLFVERKTESVSKHAGPGWSGFSFVDFTWQSFREKAKMEVLSKEENFNEKNVPVFIADAFCDADA